ncbi:MAG TPA: SDR family oxidoreductase [Dongiaceae bacterium]|nr:SDR family oxidoreductase [Dongiaceae bacterium]
MPEEKRLAGRVALVTGAGKRLGRVIALRLAQEGADVAVHYGKSATEAEEVVREIEKLGRRSAAFPAELTNVNAIHGLVAAAVSHFGQLDILINSAANFLETKFADTPESIWDASLDTNLKAPFFCCQAAAPHLAKSGHGAIVNFADIGGIVGWREFLPHSLSKTGIILMTRVLAKELGPAIRVNALAPGTITMPGDPPEWQQEFTRLAPLHRSGRPDEIADAVMFLLTAEFVTGHTLVIDGGRTV